RRPGRRVDAAHRRGGTGGEPGLSRPKDEERRLTPVSRLVGRRVDRYEVLAQLGQGGFGAVYRARHAVLGTEVALKVLWPDHAGDPVMVERFLREARAAATIGSPHIAHVADAGTTAEGIVFLAMELLPGR